MSVRIVSVHAVLAALTAVALVASTRAQAPPTDWPLHGRTEGETRFSPLARINAETVKDLGLAWSFATETTRGLEATPIVTDGVLYTIGSWSVVFAIDARTGKQLRGSGIPRSRAPSGAKACCDVVNRGVAVHRGRVYVGTLDGRLASLDAESGKVLWQTVTVDQTQNYTITGAPRIVKDKVIIGNGGGEYGVRGYVSAYDAETGKLAWRFYTVPGDPAQGLRVAGDGARREDVDRRMVEAGRRRHGVGFAGLRSRARSALRRHRQRLAVEPAAAQPGRRRQPVSLVDPRAAARHRRAGVALPDDAGRNVGLHRDAAHDPRRPHDRRAARARC